MIVDAVLTDASGAFPFTAVEGDSLSGDYASILWAERGLVCRKLRAARMHNDFAVFQEVGAAFQFPGYYSGGWDATSEFIRDLNWLRADAGYVVIITDAEYLLMENLSDLPKFIAVLSNATRSWSQANMTIPEDRWRLKARPFHTVLFTENLDLLRSRWPVALQAVQFTNNEDDV
ncbi:MAG TPA: barstar family protein [Galbitalea sp.]|nr:barstar family protein [Galbitalea sp.]